MLSNLPKDLKILILSFLHVDSISNFCLSCKEYNKLFSNQKLVSGISFFSFFQKKINLFLSFFPIKSGRFFLKEILEN